MLLGLWDFWISPHIDLTLWRRSLFRFLRSENSWKGLSRFMLIVTSKSKSG